VKDSVKEVDSAYLKKYIHIYYSVPLIRRLEASWNVIAQTQKPDFVSPRNGRVHLNRRGRQFSRLLAAEVCSSVFIVGSNAGYSMFRGSVKDTDYPLHSPVSPSLPLPCVTVCHHISTAVYLPVSKIQNSQLLILNHKVHCA